MSKLNRRAVESAAPAIAARLGAGKARLERIVALLDPDGQANLAAVLAALYPKSEREAALSSLRQFRLAIKRAAGKAPAIEFALAGDEQTRTAPEDRSVWFEGRDPLAAQLSAHQQASLGPTSPDWVDAEAIRLGARCHVVYASEDKADAHKLLKLLEPLCAKHEVELWTEDRILPGENRQSKIGESLAACDLAIVLVTPNLEADPSYPELRTRLGARAFPVQLHYTRAGDTYRDPQGRSFDAVRMKDHRRAFARGLMESLQGKLAHRRSGSYLPIESLDEFVEGDVDSITLERSIEDQTRQAGLRRSAIDSLRDWAHDPAAPPYCVLLGELGMGKTTTVKELARQLQAERDTAATDVQIRQPIYFDLRYVRDLAPQSPGIRQILAGLLDKQAWMGGAGLRPPGVDEIVRLAAEGALIIFDGLDEVLVNLSSAAGQQFTRQLFALAPPVPGSRARLLITCRSHYFRSLAEQAAHFTTEGRDPVNDRTYRAFVLLPFGDDQIREYLELSLGSAAEAARALELIRTVHNLPELAERPYTLNLIRRQLQKLEQAKAEGRPVTGLTLYRFFVEDWLLRDTGKHQFQPEHKQMLMEHVAGALARAGQRSWRARQLEDWLGEFLDGHSAIAARYREVKREQLEEDLRTATFLVREGDEFRFAHSSLQEYFLAMWLRRALEEAQPDRWALTAVSLETLDFLGQSLLEKASTTAMAGLKLLRDTYRLGAGELAFRYFVLAFRRRYPAPLAVGFQLPAADLRKVEVDAEGMERFDLSRANLTGARLGGSFWRNVRLRGAEFGGTDAARSEWLDCDLRESRWGRADLTAALLRECFLQGAELAEVQGGRSEWLYCEDAPEDLAAARLAPGRAGSAHRQVSIQHGHGDSVNGCAWSVDGRRIVSASRDDTLKIWDAESGECLLTLSGHAGRVNGCAWSGDGRRIVSASRDQTLKIWDAESGECLLTLSGHTSYVNGCAWSGNGRRIVSASRDSTLKIWDAESGECLLTLSGHTSYVNGCAWGGDGRRIVSASDDSTLRIWDAESGECLLTLSGHASSVNGCAWSGDGRRIVSASGDSTLKIWDAESGECLLTLSEYGSSVNGCAWSGDGRRIVSASNDGTLKTWDAESGECLLTLYSHATSVSGYPWSGDGRRIVSACSDSTLKIWDAESGECLLTLSGHARAVNGCAWSGDGRCIVSACSDSTLKIWDAESGECLLTLSGHRRAVNGCAWSGDGRRIVSASDDATLKIWDAESGECLLTLSGHASSVNGRAWSGDGQRIVSASGDTLKIWDAESGECLLTLSGHALSVTGCAWSGDGRRIVSASHDGTLKTWDAESGECLLTLSEDRYSMNGCAWSGDSQRIVSASWAWTLKIWDAESGERLLTLYGHASSVTACAWSGDGRRIVSASDDRTLKIWDAESGECLLTSTRAEAAFQAVQFSPDGRTIVAACNDGSVRLYAAETLDEIQPRRYHLWDPRENRPTWATVDLAQNRIVACGPGAWRSLGWIVPDPADGLPMRLPAETFGRLPTRGESSSSDPLSPQSTHY